MLRLRTKAKFMYIKRHLVMKSHNYQGFRSYFFFVLKIVKPEIAALSKVHHSRFTYTYSTRFYIHGRSYLVAEDDSAFGSLFWTIDKFFFILGSGMIKISNKNQFDWISYEIKIWVWHLRINHYFLEILAQFVKYKIFITTFTFRFYFMNTFEHE